MKDASLRKLIDSIQYEVTDCTLATVGFAKSKDESEPYYNWNSSPDNPFKDLNVHRIYLVTEGEAQIYTNESMRRITAGNVYFLPANTIIATKCSTLMRQYYIHFKTNESAGNFYRFVEYRFGYAARPEELALFEAVDAGCRSEDPGQALRIQGCLRLLLAPFFERSRLKNVNILKFDSVLRYIDEHLSDEIEIATLADLIHIDSGYFSNYFSQTFGIPPLRYIQHMRIQEARKLLVNLNIPVNEIARMCGYADALYFSRVFKKIVGLSPFAYRKSILA